MLLTRDDGRSRGKAFAVANTRVDSCFSRNDKRGRQVMTGKGRNDNPLHVIPAKAGIHTNVGFLLFHLGEDVYR